MPLYRDLQEYYMYPISGMGGVGGGKLGEGIFVY